MKITLKAARVNAGYSQESLAKQIGVSKSTVSRWEVGVLPIPNEKLLEICEICGLEKESIIIQERKRD